MKVLCIEWLFTHNKKIAYICRNYILAKKLYKDLIQYIPNEYIKQANGTDLTIESIFGSSITFFSAESGASLRGLTFHYLILDEFAFFKQEQTDGTNLWNDILFPTIKVNGILTVFVSTPLGKNNLFHTMYLRGLDESYPTYHSILKDIHSIGWDIAIGKNGPIFIEGNDNWEINGPQICHGGLKKLYYEMLGV